MQDTQFFETYLFNQEEALSKLIKGTDKYYYFTLLKHFNENGFNNDKKIQIMMEEFKELGGDLYKKIEFRSLFLEYDYLDRQESNNEIISQKRSILLKLQQILLNEQNNENDEDDEDEDKNQNDEFIKNLDKHQENQTNEDINAQIQATILDAYEKGFWDISLKLIDQVDINKLLGCSPSVIKSFIAKILRRIIDFKFSPQLLQWLHENNERIYYQKLSINQMDQLIKQDKKILNDELFVEEYYYKNYNSYNKELDQKQKIEILKKFYDWSLNLPPKYKILSDKILQQLLKLGQQISQYDFDLFVQFLKDPGFEYEQISQKHQKNIKNRIKSCIDLKKYSFIKLVENEKFIDIIQDYLEKYFQIKEDYKIFLPYLNETFLKQELAYYSLLNGKQCLNIHQIFNNEQLEEFQNNKYIEICNFNKKIFNQDEEVKIHINLKNIQFLNIKVFEIQCESYYLLKCKEIDSDIELDGLIAQEEINFQYEIPPIIEHCKVFTFDTITKSKRGVFIVDFIGNGVQSRAILRKGSLNVIQKQTPFGHQFKILDEDFNVCSGIRTGFWTKDTFYQINPNSHDILIPFQSQATLQAIVVHDNFAQLSKITITDSQCKLECGFIVCREAFICGMTSQMILCPRLFISGELQELNLLFDVKVQVECFSKNEILLQTNEFFIKDLSNSNPLIEIQFAVNKKYVQLVYKIMAKININDDISELEEEFILDIEHSDEILSQFLKKTSEGYEIFVYGRNGDPKYNIGLEINLFSSLLNKFQRRREITDEQGKVFLGKCENNEKIISQISNTSIKNEWIIRPIKQYQQKKIIKLGEEILFPFSEYFSIIQIDEEGDSLRSCMEYKKEEKFINFKPDVEGNYLILWEEYNKEYEIELNVVNGYNLKDNLVIQNNKLFQLNNQTIPLLAINHEIMESKTIIRCLLPSNCKNTIVIAVISQFQESEYILQNIDQLSSKNDIKYELYCKEIQNNIYISNRSLSDEIKYVLNRQQMQPQLGNQLQKPQILLKRQLQSLTETSLEQESDKRNIPTTTIQNDQNRSRFGGKGCGKVGACRRRGETKKMHQIHQVNFLKHPAIILKDLNNKLDGNFSFEIPNFYQQITFYLINGENIITQCYPLPSFLQTRDLTHISQLEVNKFYNVVRTCTILKENQILNLFDNDIQYKLIQSNNQLFQELLKLNQKCNLSQWKFLVDWYKMEISEKNKFYSKYQSNELNIFIRFKDQEYFQNYIKPYIQNKIDKDLIDYFLLEDRTKLVYYSQLKQQRRLNHLELLLLLIYFSEIEKNSIITQHIFQIFVNPLIQEQDDRYKELFDKILSSNSEDDIEINKQVFQNKPIATKCAGKSNVSMQVESDDENENEDQSDSENKNRKFQINKPHRFRPGSILSNDMKSTKEYSETHYYNLQESKTNRIGLNKFWVDLATHQLQSGILCQSFTSTNFLYNISNLTQILSILTFMGLPNKPKIQSHQISNNQIQISSDGPSILFTKEVKEAQSSIKQYILLEQQYFELSDQSQDQPSPNMINQFLVDRVYGCKIIVTNSSNEQVKGQILIEIPNGSIPIASNVYNWSQQINLDPYSTKKLEDYHFYFPLEGKYTVYPANLSMNGIVEAMARKIEFNVSKTKQHSEISFRDVLEQDQVKILQYIQKCNVHDLRLFQGNLISNKLLMNKQFYKQLIDILRNKNYYSDYIWRYSMQHLDNLSIREYLTDINSDDLDICYFKSNLIEINKIRFLEYYPLVNQRAHKDSNDSNMILNTSLKRQWRIFLDYLVQKNQHDNNDLITLTYYLLIQEKKSQAIITFNRIKTQSIQYDYLSAYLDFVTGYPNFIKARQICDKYIDYPVSHWRNLFYEMLNQLTEFDQDDNKMEIEYIDNTKINIDLEEALSMNVIGKQLHIQYSNSHYLNIQFYLIDIELLFSINPFSKNYYEQFSFVKPNKDIKIDLDQQQTSLIFDIPEELLKQNLQIQVMGQQKRVYSKYVSTNIKVQIMQNKGFLRVFNENGKYQSHVYVKTFIKDKQNKVSFYKDGYTDIGGKFDYFSVSSPLYNTATKFAILVVGNNLGSVILEVNPPTQLKRYQDIELLSKPQRQQQDFQINQTKKVKIN